MSSLFVLFPFWFGLTNHFLRGISYTKQVWVKGKPQSLPWDEQPLPFKILGVVTNHVAWAIYSGLVVGLSGYWLYDGYDWMVAIITMVNLIGWAVIGSSFDTLSQTDGDSRLENFIEDFKRGLYILPLFASYAVYYGDLSILVPGLISAILYAGIPLCIGFFYHDKAYWAHGLNETLYGILGQGVMIAWTMIK